MQKPLGPFGRLGRWSVIHRLPVLIGAAILAVLATLGALQLDVDSNLLALLPDDEPAAEALRDLHEAEGGANLVTLAFETDEPARMDPYLDGLVQQLQQIEGVQFAVHEIDEDLSFRLGLLQLSTQEVETLTVRLKGALALGPALNPIVTQRLMDLGPLTEKIAGAGNTSLLGSADEGEGRVLVRPTGSSTDPIFAKRLMEDVDAVIAASDPAAHGVELTWVGGAYRHNVEDREGIWQDIQRTGIASFALVLVCVMIAFRSVPAAVLLYAPVLLGSVVNLSIIWVLFGTVNTYTSFGTAVLLGLGIDYGTHLVARYREMRQQGHEVPEAVGRAWDRTAQPCVTSAITSMAGFLALATAQFQGFSQLGIALAVGLGATLTVTLVLMPALIAYLDPNPKMLLGARHSERTYLATYRLAPLGLMAAVVATGLAATTLTKIEWEYDISALRRTGLAYDELTPEEQALAKASYSPVVVTYDDREALIEDQRRIEGLIADGDLPHISRAVSIETVLPHDQEARLYALAQLADLVENPNMRYLPPPIVKNVLRLRGFEPTPITRQDLPPAVLQLLGARDAQTHRMLLFPKGNMWDLREAAKLADEVQTAIPDRPVAGEYVALGALYRIVVADMPKVAILALLLVGVLTLIDLKRFHWFAGAYGTLLAGTIWAGVALHAIGVKLSILNVVGLPILVGIGVDVCIHLLHRLREEGPGGVTRAMQTTGVAAVVSTFTTVAAFGSLILAGNRGIRSLGMLVAVGITAVLLVAALLLPLAWAAGWRVTGRAPGDTSPRRKRHVVRDVAVSESSDS